MFGIQLTLMSPRVNTPSEYKCTVYSTSVFSRLFFSNYFVRKTLLKCNIFVKITRKKYQIKTAEEINRYREIV